MPVIIDGDSGVPGRHGSGAVGPVSCQWDVNAAETLFWKPVPVRLKVSGADDRSRNLSIRILLWDNATRRVPKVHTLFIHCNEFCG
jgi:hypothetical protein